MGETEEMLAIEALACDLFLPLLTRSPRLWQLILRTLSLEIVDVPAPSIRRLRAARDARAVALVAAVAPDDNAAPAAVVPAAAGEGAGQVLYRGHELATGSILLEDCAVAVFKLR
jgi:hypothetical protein